MNSTATHFDNTQRLWDTRYGTMTALAMDDLASRSLHHYGEWAEQELDLLSGFVQDGQSVLEFGGDHGAHTLWLARAVGDEGQVHVAEPRRLEFQQLCANLALNALTNVHTHSTWLGRESGRAALSELMSSAHGSDEKVRKTSVDGLDLESLHLLKVNLPGTLTSLLAGAEETVRRYRPVVYFRLGGIDEAAAEIKALKDRGYRCWSHLPYLFNTDNHAGHAENIFPGCASQNVIAAPIEGRLEFDRLREI